MQVKINADEVLKGFVAAQEKINRGIELYAKTAAVKLEARAKESAPWTDRTGNARQTIKGVSGWGGVDYTINTFQTDRFTDGRFEEKIGSVVNNRSDVKDGETMVVAVTGNMYYSVFLELAHGKKYAVLWPTVNELTPEILQGYASMLNKIK